MVVPSRNRDLLKAIGIAAALLALVLGMVSVGTAAPKDDTSDEQYIPAAYLAASGGPDRFGYTYADSGSAECAFPRLPTAATAPVPLPFVDADEGTAALPIGFPFPFYGRSYTHLTIDSNGSLLLSEARLSTATPDWFNRALGPNGPSPRLAPFWDDLVVEEVTSQLQGTVPDRALLVTFRARLVADGPLGSPLHLQLLLHEDGRILFHYLTLPPGRGDGAGATVGIQGPAAGLGYLFNGYPRANRLHDNLTVCFLPPDGIYLSPGVQHGYATMGHDATYTIVAVNQSGHEAAFDFAVDSVWPASVVPSRATIAPGTAVDLTVTVHVPPGEAGQRHEATVQMASAAGDQMTVAYLQTVRGSGNYGFVGSRDSKNLTIIDLDTNAALTPTLSLLPPGGNLAYPQDMTLSPDGREVWIADASNDDVIVVDTTALTITRRIAAIDPGEWAVDVAFDEKGELAFASYRGTLSQQYGFGVIDTASYAPVYTIPVPLDAPFGPGHMTLNHCSGELYVADYFDDHFLVIDSGYQTVTHDIRMGTSLWDVVMDPAATTLYLSDRGSEQIHIVDPVTLTVTESITVTEDPWRMDITPDGNLLFVPHRDSESLSIIDLNLITVTEKITFPSGADPRDVDISSDGAYAYVTSGDVTGDDNDAVYVIDVATLQWTKSIILETLGTNDPFSIAVAPEFASLDPVASFTSTSPVLLGTPVHFTDTSTSNPTSWLWDFGDGVGTATNPNPVYNYANPGSYTVTLTATNQCGSDIFTGTVTVRLIDIYLPMVRRP